MTIRLPPHRIDRLWEVLNSIPANQKRTSVKTWHKISYVRCRSPFRVLQHVWPKALSDGQQSKHHITLKKGVHQALDDFRWLAKTLQLASLGLQNPCPQWLMAIMIPPVPVLAVCVISVITSVLGKDQTQLNQSFGALNGLSGCGTP
ncbi:LOW QUALITY PROTEIN: hypothetical protein ACHAXR_000864 [Thalassiosira sp. AJA248-18]